MLSRTINTIRTFLGLTDTPSSYTGQAGLVVKVKGDETGLEFGTGGGVTDHALLTNLNWASAGHTIDANVNFAGFRAVALVCDNGVTLPSSPVSGQWFLHTPTGRKVLMMYDGSAWQPIWNNGAATMYVGSTGTDSQNNGGATGTGAFLTIQFAVNQIAGLVGGDVTINVAAGTYNESVKVEGKYATGAFNIIIEGARTVAYDGIVTSGSGGTGATRASVTAVDTDPSWLPWTTNQWVGYFVRFKDNTTTTALRGVVRPIVSNPAGAYAGTLTLCGTLNDATPAGTPPTPVSGDTFEIFSNGAIIDGQATRTTCFINGVNQQGVLLRTMHMQNTNQSTLTTYAVDTNPFGKPKMGTGGFLNLQGCSIDNAGGITVTADNGFATYWCYILSNYIQLTGGKGSFWNTFINAKASGGIGILAAYTSLVYVKAGTTIRGLSNTGYGLYVTGSTTIYTGNGVNEGYLYIAGWSTGAYALATSVIVGTSNNQYTDGALTNTTNESAVSASYGYID